MENFLQKHGKKLSVCLSVICSVFLVAVVVSAATTIGANISTGGTLTVTGGFATSTLDGITIGGTTKAAGSFTSLTSTGVYTPTGGIATSTLDNVVIGGSTKAVGSFSLLNVGGAAATSTINAATAGGVGKGTCIVLTATNGTNYYLSVTSTPSAGAPWTVLAISSTSCQ